MKESIFTSSIRFFCAAFFCMLGIFFAIILSVVLINAADRSDNTISNDYSVNILPNAEGVRKKQSSSSPVILQLNLHGLIGLEDISQKSIREILIESREGVLKKDRVKAILLNCNTPGGSMTDADGIFQALMEYKKRYNVPVYAYVDGLLASAGVYIACAADKIYSSDISLIGSVGVITPSFVNVSKLMEKVGIDSLTLYAGKGKDDLNPLRPWKADEADNYKEIIDYYYNSFVELVVKHRPKIDRSKLVKELGANIYPAEQALKLGFIDAAGASRESTLKSLLKQIGIEDDYYQVVELESSSWLSQLFKSQSPILNGILKHEVQFGHNLPSELSNQPLYLYRPSPP